MCYMKIVHIFLNIKFFEDDFQREIAQIEDRGDIRNFPYVLL